MTVWERVRRWPMSVKVPLLVATLMIVVAASISNMVLLRLGETQTRHFQQLTGAYLDGLSTALHQHVIRRDPWEAFDVLDRARGKYSGVNSSVVLVALSDNTVLASSDPMRFPLQSMAPESPGGHYVPDLSAPSGRLWINRVLLEGGVEVGRVAAEIDIAGLQAARSQTVWALVGVNSVLTVAFAGLGWLLVRRMIRPLALVSARLAEAQDGRLIPIPPDDLPRPDSEVGRALRHYNAAADAVAERQALLQRLAEEERRALVGRFASAVAHEVNNPLGGLFNAVRMIQKHGDDPEQRNRAARLLERGLTGIHNVVRAQLVVWRGEAETRLLASADVEDLRFLIASEAGRRDLTLHWSNVLAPTVPVPAQTVRQVALNLLLNACAATPPGGIVRFRIEDTPGALVLSVTDGGPGLPPEARAVLEGRNADVLPTATGLGLWTVARLVSEYGGSVTVEGPPGAAIHVRFPHVAVKSEMPAVA